MDDDHRQTYIKPIIHRVKWRQLRRNAHDHSVSHNMERASIYMLLYIIHYITKAAGVNGTGTCRRRTTSELMHFVCVSEEPGKMSPLCVHHRWHLTTHSFSFLPFTNRGEDALSHALTSNIR